MHRHIYTHACTHIQIYKKPPKHKRISFCLNLFHEFYLTCHITTNNLFCEQYCSFYCPEYLKAEMMTSFTLTPLIKLNIELTYCDCKDFDFSVYEKMLMLQMCTRIVCF